MDNIASEETEGGLKSDSIIDNTERCKVLTISSPRAARSCLLGWCSGRNNSGLSLLCPVTGPPLLPPAFADAAGAAEEGEEGVESEPGTQGSVRNHMLGFTQHSAASRRSGCRSGFELRT